MLRLTGSNAKQVAVRAFKKAEDSDELVLRVQELYGWAARETQIALPNDIASVREINAAEEATSSPGRSQIKDGKLIFDLNAYQPRSFALKLKAFHRKALRREAQALRYL
jgi:alpha-mannosidase